MGRYLLLDAERHEAALTPPAARLARRTAPAPGDAEPGLAHGLAGPLALAASAEVSVSGLRTSVRRLAARL